jgi:hypothetical protein
VDRCDRYMERVYTGVGRQTVADDKVAREQNGLLGYAQKRSASQRFEALRCRLSVASARFVHHELRVKKRESSTTCPPFAGDLLMCGDYEITGRPRRQVADDGGLDVHFGSRGHRERLHSGGAPRNAPA